MAVADREYLGKHKKFRLDSKKLATVFIVLAFVVAVIVFWWLKLVGITVTGEAFCGLQEHTHGAECYVSEIICSYDDTSGTLPLQEDETSETVSDTSEQETTGQVHVHTDECYEKVLVCTKSEHTHSSDCFPDKTADVETVSDWLSTIEDIEITNNIPENLVKIAMSQMGYEESEKNFEYDSEGNKNGYTRYGEWYGNPYGNWNTMFVSFCLHYSNINNDQELKSAGAEAMRLAWQEKGVYAAADEYTAERGDVVFIDSDSDETADIAGIVIAADDNSLTVICGDSNNKVETLTVDISDNDDVSEDTEDTEDKPDNIYAVIGYGLTGELHFAKDTEYEEETSQSDSDTQETTPYREPLMMMAASPEPNIIYHTDLTQFIVDVSFKTEDNVEITEGSTVYIGQTYIISMEFKEKNTGDQWLQFGHNDEHYLTYQIPSNIHCEPFTDWRPITAITENGTIEDVGKYFIDENGFLKVTFYDDENGVCFGHRYSNVDFIIDFNATIGTTQSGTSTDVIFNDEINVNLNVDGGAGVTISKTHGDYDSDTYTMDYILTVEATHGVVKDFTLEDYTWYNHQILKDSIVVTDLNGVPLDPQPTIGDNFTQADNIVSGFSLVGLPDFAAGEGFLITYKSKISDAYISQDKVSLGNGVYGAGKDSNGNTVDSYKEHWVDVEPEKMTKDGRQTVVEVNGQNINVIEWRVVIKKNHNNLHGTVIIDTLGEGLQYLTDKDIIIKHYDENGENPFTESLSWDAVEINGNSMSFPLPDGYMFEIVYYTTYEEPEDDKVKNFTNTVSATINGKYETAGGEADVVSFIPRIDKSARGNDGEYVYFTIEADVPALIKNWGSFYLTDEASLWNEALQSFYYVDNMPEDMVISAVTKSGDTVIFTPYVAGGPTENTYILEAPLEGDRHHSFRIFFNTSSASEESSKWILNEDSVLTITYKLPFDSKTGWEWSGELTGNKELGDLLLENYLLANTANLNYTDIITDTASTNYTYTQKITKNSKIHEDGTVDYTVVFHNTVPGSNGNAGILSAAQNIIFTDTFDEKMEYIPGSLTLKCYDPWNSSNLLNIYKYNGTVAGNNMNISATDLVFDSTNPNSGWGADWLSTLSNYQIYCNNMSGGEHIFTYTLKLKDEYLYTTEENKLILENTAELLWDTDSTSGPVTETTEFKTGLVDKSVVQESNKLLFDIHINNNALDILPGSDTLTIEDTMTNNLSVYWNSIKLYYEDYYGNWIDFDSAGSAYSYTVTYDQHANRLTFVVPDSLHIRIDYTTLVTQSGHVSVNNAVRIDGKAQVTDIIDAIFTVQDSSGGASGSVHNITLLKQDGDTDMPLSDVTFYLYGPMGDPGATLPSGVQSSIVTDAGKTLYYIGSYTTGADGTEVIETQYLTLGGPYALVEKSAPMGYNKLEKPTYFYFYEPDPNGIIQTVTTIVVIENYSYGFVLPETGGIGTLPLTIIGCALMAFPILYSIIRRKRERRSEKISP